MRTCVLGAGSWGTALSLVLARNGHSVALRGRDREEMEIIQSRRENLKYLPGFALPPQVEVAHWDEPIADVDLWVLAVPSGGVRAGTERIPAAECTICIASKGLESHTALRMSEIVQEARPRATCAVLSGPNLAVEIARGIPTAAVSASRSDAAAEQVRSVFMNRGLRIYVSSDVVGVELAGALKNVLAIGAGMSDGLGFGDNTKGALLARGLCEMARLGVAAGADLETFLGIAGVGDLFATAHSTLSRNYRVGAALGSGRTLSEALSDVGQVAEGVATADCAMKLSQRYGVSTPVFEATDLVLRGRLDPRRAVELLMERTPQREGVLGKACTP
jgi:glycerol-3-phosphate dehydrogenase (NAD(P)+)